MENGQSKRRRVLSLGSPGRVAAASLAFACACLGAPRAAHADPTCISAYEQAQTLRKDGKLVSAKAQAAICARAECPALLTKDCTKWLAELESSTPTVVFDARTPQGKERVDVRVKVDGVVLVQRLDGKAVAVDPGSHTFVFEVEGATPVEQTVVIREGEKNRKLAATVATDDDASAKGGARPVPTGVWIFGGVSLVALTTSLVFALDGFGKKSDLDECKPRCAPDDVDAMNARFAVADVTLGIGLAAGAAAAYFFFTRPSVEPGRPAGAAQGPAAAGVSTAPRPLAAPFLVPLPGGAGGGFSARF